MKMWSCDRCVVCVTVCVCWARLIKPLHAWGFSKCSHYIKRESNFVTYHKNDHERDPSRREDWTWNRHFAFCFVMMSHRLEIADLKMERFSDKGKELLCCKLLKKLAIPAYIEESVRTNGSSLIYRANSKHGQINNTRRTVTSHSL